MDYSGSDNLSTGDSTAPHDSCSEQTTSTEQTTTSHSNNPPVGPIKHQYNVQKAPESLEQTHSPNRKHHLHNKVATAAGGNNNTKSEELSAEKSYDDGGFSRAKLQASTSTSPGISRPLQVDGHSPISGKLLQHDIPPVNESTVLNSVEIKTEPEDSDMEMDVELSDRSRTLSAATEDYTANEATTTTQQDNSFGARSPLFVSAGAELAKRRRSLSLDSASANLNKKQKGNNERVSAAPRDRDGLTAKEVHSPALARLRAQFPAPAIPMPPPPNVPVGRQAAVATIPPHTPVSVTPNQHVGWAHASLQSALVSSRVSLNLAAQAIPQAAANGPMVAARIPAPTNPAPSRVIGHVHNYGHPNQRKKGKSYYEFSPPHQQMIRSTGGIPPPEYVAPLAIHHNLYSVAPPKNMNLSRITIPMTAKELLTFAPRHTNNHGFQHRMTAAGILGADQASMISYQRDLRAPDAPLSNTTSVHIMNSKKTAPATPDPRLRTDLSPSWWAFSPHNKETWDCRPIDYPLTALGNGVSRAKWPVLNDRGPFTMALEHATTNGHHFVLLSGLDAYIAQQGLSRTLPDALLNIRCGFTGRLLTPDEDFISRHKKDLKTHRLWLRVDAESRGFKWV